MSFRFTHGASSTTAILVALLLSSFSWADGPVDMDAAARAYRIRVYRTFRMNRSEYDRRIEMGKEVLSAWTGGGSPEEEQEVFRWFLAASEASTEGTVSPLPSLAVMDTLNSRRIAYNNDKKRKRKNAVKNSFVRRKKKKKPAMNTATQQPRLASQPQQKSSGGFGNLMGQLVNQGLNLVGGGNSEPSAAQAPSQDMPTPASANPSTPSNMTGFGENSEKLVMLDAESSTGSSADHEATVQSINETVIGQNLVVEEVRGQLKTEWDFDPSSAMELVSNLESIAANELEIRRRVVGLPPAYHGQVDPLVSVNELLGDVNERLMALKSGRHAFADEGFGADKMQALEDRLEQVRVDLKL